MDIRWTAPEGMVRIERAGTTTPGIVVLTRAPASPRTGAGDEMSPPTAARARGQGETTDVDFHRSCVRGGTAIGAPGVRAACRAGRGRCVGRGATPASG